MKKTLALALLVVLLVGSGVPAWAEMVPAISELDEAIVQFEETIDTAEANRSAHPLFLEDLRAILERLRLARESLSGEGDPEIGAWGDYSSPLGQAQPELRNLSKQGVASQSSTGYNAPAARAIDGDTNGAFYAGSVSHTATEAEPWWELDLGQVKYIDHIHLWNRSDGIVDRAFPDLDSRMKDIHVYVSERPFVAAAGQRPPWSSDVFFWHTADILERPSVIAVEQPGRYIRVQIEGRQILNLAEVEVFGY